MWTQSASWDAAKTYAMATFTPPGTATAGKIMKVANSLPGKIAIGISEKMLTKITDDCLKGKYNNTDGEFDFSKIPLNDIFWESTITTLVEMGLGSKADELLGKLKQENKVLGDKLTKLVKRIESGTESTKRLKNYAKSLDIKGQADKIKNTKFRFKKQLAKEKAMSESTSKYLNEKRKKATE